MSVRSAKRGFGWVPIVATMPVLATGCWKGIPIALSCWRRYALVRSSWKHSSGNLCSVLRNNTKCQTGATMYKNGVAALNRARHVQL